MSAHQSFTDLYTALTSGYANIDNPGAGGTFDLNGQFYSRVTLTASGTYTLPNLNHSNNFASAYGTQLLVCCDDTSTITLADGGGTFHVFTGTTGTTSVLCIYQGSSRWAAVRLDRSTVNSASLASISTHLLSTQGFIDLPLANWREVFTNDTGVAATGAAQGSGGILATDTTPALEYVNGDTNSTLRLLWAAGNSNPLVTQLHLPPDCDLTEPIVFHAIGVSGGLTDTPVLDLDSYFTDATGGGGTKVEDATGAFIDSVDKVTATIAAADLAGSVMTLEITPGTHTSDTLAVFSTYLTYTKKLLTS